jgi:hypothetical protein
VHRGIRPYRCLGHPPPAANAVFVGDANTPVKKGKHKENAICKPDEVAFIIIVNYGNVVQ